MVTTGKVTDSSGSKRLLKIRGFVLTQSQLFRGGLLSIHRYRIGLELSNPVSQHSFRHALSRAWLRRGSYTGRFLRKAGAPLDNNICERALKKAILHRKNSLFFGSRREAQVGDIYMSLIYSCELNNVNAFDYLNQLQLHASEVVECPERWMPWNYLNALASCGDTQKSS